MRSTGAAGLDDEREDRARRSVQSIEVGGRLLLALAEHRGPMSLKDLAACAGLPASRAHGTSIHFRPDAQIFGDKQKFDVDTVRERLETKSYLHKGLKLTFGPTPIEKLRRLRPAFSRFSER